MTEPCGGTRQARDTQHHHDRRRSGSQRFSAGTHGLFLIVTAAVGLAGCRREPVEPLELAMMADAAGMPGGTQNGWDLPLVDAGQLARAFPGSPCATATHRQFDFWVGEWNVTNVNGVQIGTNIVTSQLDGCLVHESWTAGNGSRGRSLNAYDAERGVWDQTWVSQVPQVITGRLRTSGNLVDGTMSLSGVRNATGGFTFLDSWTWSENDQGQVIQNALTVVPELNLQFPFTGIYTRGDDVTPAPPLITQNCAAGAVGGETRLADFLVGEWNVSSSDGLPLGSSLIELDLSDCLFVEHFDSRGGLSAIAFTYVDLWVERWFRTYVDSEGERLEQEGGFENGALVLRGTEDSRSGPVDVAITWRPDPPNVLQTWRVSRDGGATWEEPATLVYSPK